MDSIKRRSTFSKNRSKSTQDKKTSKYIVTKPATDPQPHRKASNPKSHRKSSDPKHWRRVSFQESVPSLKSTNFTPSSYCRDALLVSSVTYHIYQYDAYSRAFNVPYAEVIEESLSKLTSKTLQVSNFSYINKLNAKYIDCIIKREQLEYLAVSNGQPSTFDNNTPSNLFIVTLLGVMMHQRCTVYIFLQVRRKTRMARLIVFGSTKIKSTFPSRSDLSKVKLKKIQEIFELSKDTERYKQFVKKHKIKKIHLFNSYETTSA
jgi:hypothetical protein